MPLRNISSDKYENLYNEESYKRADEWRGAETALIAITALASIITLLCAIPG